VVPIKTERFDGIYGAPKNLEGDIGGLPYYREINQYYETTEVFSVWEPTIEERVKIANGENILISQMSEPIRPMSVQVTQLKRVEENAETEEK
jgi:hypothetical protein